MCETVVFSVTTVRFHTTNLLLDGVESSEVWFQRSKQHNKRERDLETRAQTFQTAVLNYEDLDTVIWITKTDTLVEYTHFL